MENIAYNWPDNLHAPVAEIIPYEMLAHGDQRIDNYYWMNDFFRKSQQSYKVVAHLEAENKYYAAMMAGTELLQQNLYTEMKARIKEQDESVPVFKNGYYYYSCLIEGKDYFVYCRKKESLDAPEEILLDVNTMAEGHSYYSATGFAVSPDNTLLAYGIDTHSRREYAIYIKNIASGEIYNEVIMGTEGSAVWANDNKTIFYTSKNPVTLLSEKIKKHQLGSDPATDEVVYTEMDPSNYIGVGKTKSQKFILIISQATLSSEVRWINADQAGDSFEIFQPRMKEVLYQVDHANDTFYIRTNLQAKNFKIVTCKENNKEAGDWNDLVPHNDNVLISGFDLFKNYLAINERKDGLTQIRILHTLYNTSHHLQFEEAAYLAGASTNPDYDTDTMRFNYTSLTTPNSVFDYNMETKERKLMKEQEVVGGYDSTAFKTDRLFATAADGTKVPVSLVYKKGFNKDGGGPLLLYAYGAYGISSDPYFSSIRLSLLNRGFAFAIAHIRGGQELGRYWYEDGKMLKKKNSFTDFISCAEFLIAEGYTSPAHLYANGGSAGGLLMGAIANMRPELWNGIIAAVPFVDVVTTMSDPSIPLTTNEYDEWGNPADEESYQYMKSYSPYDNVEEQDYPNMLVTTGLHDSQVQYFEPAKWVAKLRAMKTGNNKIFLYTNMEAGHGGASGRYKPLIDKAREYAFLLALEGRLE
ncbi:MAG: S9 family peptidase [Ferruginibacter sp.]